MKRSTKILLLIIIISILIRITAINNPLYDDETNSVESVYNPGPFLTVNPISIHPHPPLAPWIYLLTGMALGAKTWVFRLVPILASIISMFLIYSISKKEYSEKTGLFAVALYGFCFYPVLASLQTDDASITIMLFLFTTLFYIKYRDSLNKKYLVLTGIFLGISMLSKYTTVFLFCIIILHSLLSNSNIKIKSILKSLYPRNLLRTFIEVIIIGVIGGAIFAIYPLLMPTIFSATFGHNSRYFGLNISSMALGMLLLWATPLLLCFALLQILKFKKKDLLWTLWTLIIFIIYVFLLSGRDNQGFLIGGIAEYSRYFMIILPALVILTGEYLSKLNFNKFNIKFISIITIIIAGIFYFINYNFIKLVPRVFSTYFQHIKNLDFNFIFSYTTSSGNLLGVNFLTSIITYTIAVIGLILYFIIKKKELRAIIIMIILASGIAVNIFLVSEYIGPVTSLDVNRANIELIDYVKANRGDLKLYSNDEGILLQINDFKIESNKNNILTGVYCETCEFLKKDLNGMVVLLNFPPLNKKFKDLTKNCKLIKTIKSKNIELGYIYICGNTK